jgi:hypothetical protein
MMKAKIASVRMLLPALALAIGLRGYSYPQVTDVSGSGTLLGDFKSESLGIRPGFF